MASVATDQTYLYVHEGCSKGEFSTSERATTQEHIEGIFVRKGDKIPLSMNCALTGATMLPMFLTDPEREVFLQSKADIHNEFGRASGREVEP